MEHLAEFFAALADATRLRILLLLHESELSVEELQDKLGEHQPKVSRHLAYLRRANLVSTRRNGKRIFYSVAKVQGEKSAILRELYKTAHRDAGP